MQTPSDPGASRTPPALGLAAALLAGVGLIAGRPSFHSDPGPVAEEDALRDAARRGQWGAPSPPPTENWLGDHAESENKVRRKAFMEHIHRHAPGVDDKAIERENGLAQIAKRNALPPPSDGAGDWVERGSDNQAGRVHVARHSLDGDTLYVGSALGGLWRGEPDGSDWTPIGDNLYGGAHWLEVYEQDGDRTLLAATDGGLIHHSSDDGATWRAAEGLPAIYRVRRLTRARTDRPDAFAVVEGWDGVWAVRSEDRGATWRIIESLDGFFGDLWIPRDGSETLYLADSGGELRVSEDLGDTWSVRGLIAPGSERVELTGSEAGAPRIYAVVDGFDLRRSDDAGASWASVASLSDYWGTLNASMLDPDRLAWGGLELWVSGDGGASAEPPNRWYDYYDDPQRLLHADMMGIDAEPNADGSETWYINTDGGLYVSTDGLQTFDNLAMRGLRVSQYYDVLTSAANPDHIAAGAQDQGYQVTQGVEQRDETLDFDQILSGDYGHLTSGDGTHALVYSVYPGFTLVQIGEDRPELAYVDWPAVSNRNIWMPPILADPDDNEVFYFPAEQLYRFDRTSTWEWAPTLHSDQRFDASEGEYISALAFAPSDSDRMVAATSHGRVWVSDDHGETWTRSAALDVGEQWLYGHALLISADDPDVITIGGSGYSNPAVYRSTDGGATWSPWADGLPSTHVYMLAEARDGSGRVAAATQTAAYVRQPGAGDWQDITGNEAPVTLYWSVEALHHEDSFRFGTYGRGIWDYQLPPAEEPPDTGGGSDDGAEETDRDEDVGIAAPPPAAAATDRKGCGCTHPAAPLGALTPIALAALAAARRRSDPLDPEPPC